MQKYKRKDNPEMAELIVEAVKLSRENLDEVKAWCGGEKIVEIDSINPDKKFFGLQLTTVVDGTRRAYEPDYIVKDNLGGFYVRWPENFERDFEEVNDDGPPQ